MRVTNTPPVPNPARAPCPRGQARQAGLGNRIGCSPHPLTFPFRPLAGAFDQPISARVFASSRTRVQGLRVDSHARPVRKGVGLSQEQGT